MRLIKKIAIVLMVLFVCCIRNSTVNCETLNLTKQMTVEIPDSLNKLQSNHSNCIYVGTNENYSIAFYVIPVSWKDKEGNKKVLKSEYQKLDIQDTLLFNLKDMELFDVKKDLWYNWRHDYVMKQYRYQYDKDKFGTFCTFASRTADELIIVAVDSHDSVANQIMNNILTTMNHKQNFFGKWFNPRSDGGWHFIFLIISSILIIAVFLSKKSAGWKFFIALLFCIIPCITMQGDWIGVLSYVVDMAIICGVIIIMGALGIEIDFD